MKYSYNYLLQNILEKVSNEMMFGDVTAIVKFTRYKTSDVQLNLPSLFIYSCSYSFSKLLFR